MRRAGIRTVPVAAKRGCAPCSGPGRQQLARCHYERALDASWPPGSQQRSSIGRPAWCRNAGRATTRLCATGARAAPPGAAYLGDSMTYGESRPRRNGGGAGGGSSGHSHWDECDPCKLRARATLLGCGHAHAPQQVQCLACIAQSPPVMRTNPQSTTRGDSACLQPHRWPCAPDSHIAVRMRPRGTCTSGNAGAQLLGLSLPQPNTASRTTLSLSNPLKAISVIAAAARSVSQNVQPMFLRLRRDASILRTNSSLKTRS